VTVSLVRYRQMLAQWVRARWSRATPNLTGVEVHLVAIDEPPVRHDVEVDGVERRDEAVRPSPSGAFAAAGPDVHRAFDRRPCGAALEPARLRRRVGEVRETPGQGRRGRPRSSEKIACTTERGSAAAMLATSRSNLSSVVRQPSAAPATADRRPDRECRRLVHRHPGSRAVVCKRDDGVDGEALSGRRRSRQQ